MFIRDKFYDGNIIYERGAVVMRLAPTWFRFGSLEILTRSGEIDLLRSLVDYIIEHNFPQISSTNSDRYLIFFEKVVTATAKMIAHWQSVGFTHGVCNTDNFSLLSITIDYGPFGFMDVFDYDYVPNTSDDEARYSFKKQAQVAHYNLEKLMQALFPLLHFHQQQIAEIILSGYNDHFKENYISLFTKKLGLRNIMRDKDENLIQTFLQILYESKSDFTLTFRHLGELSLENLSDKTILDGKFWTIKQIQKHSKYEQFMKIYKDRLEKEDTNDHQRQLLMLKTNPVYVLRNWMAEKAINLAEQNDFSDIHLLNRILANPFVRQDEAEKEGFSKKPPFWASHISISCSS